MGRRQKNEKARSLSKGKKTRAAPALRMLRRGRPRDRLLRPRDHARGRHPCRNALQKAVVPRDFAYLPNAIDAHAKPREERNYATGTAAEEQVRQVREPRPQRHAADRDDQQRDQRERRREDV